MEFWLCSFVLFVFFVVHPPSLFSAEPRKVGASHIFPFGEKPIDYWANNSHDPVGRLQRRIEEEKLDFAFDKQFGYLTAILKELEVPVESQLLLHSTGSPHRFEIKPERPRAVYFNDDVSVAWHPGTALLEFASQDSLKGTLFYTLTNREDARPAFHRSTSQICLGCHGPTLGSDLGAYVPGHSLRTFLSDEEIRSYKFGYISSHTLPLDLRWNGRYVTGIVASQPHRGNLTTGEHWRLRRDDPTYYRHVPDLAAEFDTSRYPAQTSDVVAHLVFDHQMLGLNLLTRLSYESQLNVRSKVEQQAIPYLLLADETLLSNPVDGNSAYAERYRQRGPKDEQGRSLYELDLKTRLFRYKISPLIHSRMMQNLPPELKQCLFQRLNAVLTGREEVHQSYTLPGGDRTETLEVLRATVPDWPKE